MMTLLYIVYLFLHLVGIGSSLAIETEVKSSFKLLESDSNHEYQHRSFHSLIRTDKMKGSAEPCFGILPKTNFVLHNKHTLTSRDIKWI